MLRIAPHSPTSGVGTSISEGTIGISEPQRVHVLVHVAEACRTRNFSRPVRLCRRPAVVQWFTSDTPRTRNSVHIPAVDRCWEHPSHRYAASSAVMLLFALVTAVILLHFVRTWVKRRRANPAGLPYPPGPTPRPIIGNLLDMPLEYYWLTYAEWAKTYGDIIHVKVFGQHILLLNSLEICIDLLEKRSAIYSDRPRLPMMNEL